MVLIIKDRKVKYISTGIQLIFFRSNTNPVTIDIENR